MRPGDAVTFGIWLGQALGVMRALAQYGKNIDPLYVSISHATAEGEFLSQPNIRCQSSFLGPSERAARRKHGNVFYVPSQFTDAYRSVRTNRPPDFIVRRVAPMDERIFQLLSLVELGIRRYSLVPRALARYADCLRSKPAHAESARPQAVRQQRAAPLVCRFHCRRRYAASELHDPRRPKQSKRLRKMSFASSMIARRFSSALARFR